MLSHATLQLKYKNLLSLVNKPVMYKLLLRVLIILSTENISLETLYIKKEYL